VRSKNTGIGGRRVLEGRQDRHLHPCRAEGALVPLHPLEILLVEQNVLVLGDGKAFHQVAAGDVFTGADVDCLHLDAVAGGAIDQIEAEVSASLMAGYKATGQVTEKARGPPTTDEQPFQPPQRGVRPQGPQRGLNGLQGDATASTRLEWMGTPNEQA